MWICLIAERYTANKSHLYHLNSVFLSFYTKERFYDIRFIISYTLFSRVYIGEVMSEIHYSFIFKDSIIFLNLTVAENEIDSQLSFRDEILNSNSLFDNLKENTFFLFFLSGDELTTSPHKLKQTPF